ncbi:MAG: HD domain-containing phosphohydrolase [bacterium]
MDLKKVLIVDDERGVRESIKMLLKSNYEIDLAKNGSEAISKLVKFKPDVVLLDLHMPDMSGIEVLQNIKSLDKDVEVILVTAYATVDTARKALRLGAFDYLTKPFNPHELETIVSRGIERREDILTRSATMEAIQHDYQSLRSEVDTAKMRIATHVRDTVYALLMSLELRDAYSGQHSMAVRWLVDQLSEYLKISAKDRNILMRAALVHDLGKIGVPEEILNKFTPLSPEERRELQQHPVLSAEIISTVAALKDLVPIIRAHHENWDGSGYPDGLAGDEIPWQAQILSICDAIHAMSSNRSYRARLPESAIRNELQTQSGRQFNPEYVKLLLSLPLIGQIHQMEDNGKNVLSKEQILEVLNISDTME